jgi:hypothetical protein
MSTWDGGFSAAQNFHPEFGYLCPSARLRRKVRGAVIALAAGTVIAASMALALLPQLAPQSPGDRGRQESARSATVLPPIDQAADLKATGVAEEGLPAATIARAVATERAAASRAQAACDDLSGSFLAPQCQLGKAGKSRATHTAHAPHDAGNRVATVAIGRADAAPQEAAPREAGPLEGGPHKPAASRPTLAAETAVAMVTTNEAPAAAMPLPKPAAPARKPVKTEHKQAPDTPAAGVPAAPSSGFDLFALFRQPPRTGNGIFAFQ